MITSKELKEVLDLFNEPEAVFAYSSFIRDDMCFLFPKRFILYEVEGHGKIIWCNNMGSHAYTEFDKKPQYKKIAVVQKFEGEYKLFK